MFKLHLQCKTGLSGNYQGMFVRRCGTCGAINLGSGWMERRWFVKVGK